MRISGLKVLAAVLGISAAVGMASDVITPSAIEKAVSFPMPSDEVRQEFLLLQETLTPIEEPADEWKYPLTLDEINLIALVTMGEAEGETEYGKRLVIDTILNRVDNDHFPDTVYDVVYQPWQFSVMWNGRIDRCYVSQEMVDLVKEECVDRSNNDCVYFMAGQYSRYGEPMFSECCHYFSSYK